MKQMMIQQGDVCFQSASHIPEGAVKVHSGPGAVVAEGEVTGHMHRVTGKAVLYKQPDGTLYLSVSEPTEVIHQTHAPVHLEPITYKVWQVREKDWVEEQTRIVED